ncbi:MAG: choice-of-anchor D domain-containing protein [Deltaproteobacteria bacterium]|nr:choice-of-anchor D domain-containing protein [Deltaproteobacteria bacterium]
MLVVAGCGGSETTRRDAGSVDGGGTATVVVVTPSFVDFGSVVQGASSSVPSTVTVTNRGAATSLSPAATGPFAVVSSTCGTLAALGTCTIGMSFTPVAVGPASGILTVAPGVSVTLTGKGVEQASFTMTDKVDLGTVLVGASVAGSVTVTAVSTVSGLSCAVSGADLTADPTQVCPATLAAGASCTVGFIFKATTPGTKSDSVVCSATGVTRSSLVTAIAVTPANLAFQPPATVTVSSPVGTASSPISFTLVNSGGSASGALTLTPAGATTEYTIDNQCILPLAANSLCKIVVVFKPTSAGTKALTLTVADANAPTTPLVATVNGIATPQGSLSITGDGDFGTVVVGAASAPAKVFTITNTGGTDTGVVTIGVTDAQFVVSADGCSNLPLAGGKTCTVSLVLKPSAAGAISAALSASAAGSATATLPIKGVGIGAGALTVDPPTLDFGTTGVGVPVGPKVFTVTNTGGTATGALVVVKDDSTSSVGGASQFTVTTTCQAPLAPLQTCQISVTFAPTIERSASATITVTDGTISSAPRTVVGIALQRPDLTITCPQGFEPTVVGQTSAAVVCTVNLDSRSAQESGALTVTVTGDFDIPAASNKCTASLQPGLSCTLSLTFVPTVKGKREGVITVTSANKGADNQDLVGIGLGVIEIVELAGTFDADGNKTGPNTEKVVDPQPYDFGQVSVGAVSKTYITLAVYVRAAVGNINLTEAFGTPAAFTLVDDGTMYNFFSPVPTDTGYPVPGGVMVMNVPPCSNSLVLPATPTKLAPTCYKIVHYTPQARTAENGTITVTGAGGQSDSATVTGTGTGPLTIRPSPVNFGNVGVGQSGNPITLTITNNGGRNITNMAFTKTGANADQFVVVSDGVTGQTIGANGGILTLQVKFLPTAVAAATATITVSGTIENSSAIESQSVTLNGNGATAAAITGTLSAAFEQTHAGARSQKVTLTVANASGAVATGPLHFSLQGAGGSDFLIDPLHPVQVEDGLQGSCAQAASNQLAGGGSCTYYIWFQPRNDLAIPSRSDTLVVSASPGGTIYVPLSGTALPQLTISATDGQGNDGSAAKPFNVGTAAVNTTLQPSLTFTVTNHGLDNIGTGAVNLSVVGTAVWPNGGLNWPNPTAADNLFRLDATGGTGCNGSATTGVAIAGNGGTCTFTLKAVATMPHLGDLFGEVRVKVASQVAASEVKATVVPDAKLELTTDTNYGTRDLGVVLLDGAPASVNYTLVNNGGIAAKGIAAAIVENPAGTTALTNTPFAVAATSPCLLLGETGLAPRATCDITVTYSPTTANHTINLVDLRITATSGLVAEIRQTIAGTPTASSAVPYLVDTNNQSPSNMGAPTVGVFSTTLVFNNQGTVAVAIPLTVAPDEGAATIGAGSINGCPEDGTTTVAAGGSCTLAVTYTPGAGAAKGWHTLIVAAGPAQMTLFALNPRLPMLVPTISPLDLGVATSAQSQGEAIVLTNTGGTATGALTVTVPSNGTIVASGCAGTSLQPLQSCTLTLAAKPAAGGLAGGNVTVAGSAASGMTNLVIPVSWSGTLAPEITTADVLTDFGNQPVLSDATNEKTFTFSNAAGNRTTGALTVAVVAGTPAAAVPDFRLLAGSTCLTGDFATLGIPGGGSCTVIVQFTPLSLKADKTDALKEGILTVSESLGTIATVPVQGTAVPALQVTGASSGGALTIVTATDGTKSTTIPSTSISSANGTAVVVTFQNTSTVATGSVVASLTGTDVAMFRISNDLCTGTSLNGGATCTVTVIFEPSSVGAKTATIALSGTPGDSDGLTMTGTGTSP